MHASLTKDLYISYALTVPKFQNALFDFRVMLRKYNVCLKAGRPSLGFIESLNGMKIMCVGEKEIVNVRSYMIIHPYTVSNYMVL